MELVPHSHTILTVLQVLKMVKIWKKKIGCQTRDDIEHLCAQASANLSTATKGTAKNKGGSKDTTSDGEGGEEVRSKDKKEKKKKKKKKQQASSGEDEGEVETTSTAGGDVNESWAADFSTQEDTVASTADTNNGADILGGLDFEGGETISSNINAAEDEDWANFAS